MSCHTERSQPAGLRATLLFPCREDSQTAGQNSRLLPAGCQQLLGSALEAQPAERKIKRVIGKSKYIYDLWGDTVNLASRMESGGLPDSIQVTRPVYDTLKDIFSFEPRGTIEVKGKGNVEAWLLRL